MLKNTPAEAKNRSKSQGLVSNSRIKSPLSRRLQPAGYSGVALTARTLIA